MKRTPLARTASATLLAMSLLLTAACGNQSGDSNPDNQTDQAPGQESTEAPS